LNTHIEGLFKRKFRNKSKTEWIMVIKGKISIALKDQKAKELKSGEYVILHPMTEYRMQ